jgi:tetratricopeptide (TPR) repeat protein
MDAVSRNNLAITLARNDPPDFERAFQLIEEAMRLAPNSPDILESYGQILSLAGKYEEAVVKLEEALEIDPNKLASRQTLEQCYRSLQMIELADAQAKIIENLGK